MANDLRHIMDDIASRADEFLAGAKDKAQGRAGVSEYITIEYSYLSPDDRKAVLNGVMAILEDEDFFGTEFVGGSFDDDEDGEE